MSQKSFIWIGLFVGGAIGGFIPELWGVGLFSMWSVILQAVGGIVGIWAGLKVSQNF